MVDDDDTGFLGRWARRKQEARESPSVPSGAETPPATEPSPAAGEAPAGEPLAVEQLPDIDSLALSSDFTVFLRAGVPEELRRRALRKLWRLDPVFANLDGLNDYDEDFRTAALGVKNLKTLYRVGRGMLGGPEEEPVQEPRPPVKPAEEVELRPTQSGPVQVAADTDAAEDLSAPAISDPVDRTREPASEPVQRDKRSAADRRWRSFKT